MIAALAFPIGFDNTGTPAGLQVAAPPGSDGLILSLGLAMEKLFGSLPPPPTVAACSGCTAHVAYVPVCGYALHSIMIYLLLEPLHPLCVVLSVLLQSQFRL